jgi:hypothetical protein
MPWQPLKYASWIFLNRGRSRGAIRKPLLGEAKKCQAARFKWAD